MGWRLEDVELSQDRVLIRLERRTDGGRQEGVIVLPVDDPVTNVTRSVSGSGSQVSVRHRTSTSLSTIKSLMAERLLFSPTDRALKTATTTLRVFLVDGLSELSGTEMRLVKSTLLAPLSLKCGPRCR